MNAPFFLSDAVVRALGWALLHSLWQGAVAALALWFVLPRLRTAAGRYAASFAALTVVFAVAATTFFWLYQPENQLDTTTATSFYFFEKTQNPALLPASEAALTTSWTATVAAWLESHHLEIVTVWLLGFGFFLLRLAGGLWFVGQLRRRQVFEVSDVLKNDFEKLLARSGIRRGVALLESGLAHTPMVLGYLKPLVLLPLGLVNRLTPAEIEAVLAHELAHIARRDWLLNLLQSFIEAVFYYHPAVWWISAVIRAEREHCCDDFAVRLCGDRLLFAKTLLRVQEFARENTAPNRLPAPALALGLEGQKSLRLPRTSLLDRVKRILNQSHTKSPLMEKFAATGLLFALAGLLALRAQSAPVVLDSLKQMAAAPVEWVADFVGEAPETPDFQAFESPADSIPKGKKGIRKISSDDGNRKVELTIEDGQLTALNVDGQDIPPADFEKYEDLTDDILADVVEPIPPMPAMAPMAPMPPVVGVTPFPAAPAFPRAYGSGYSFSDGGKTLIVTEKGDGGKTIIRLEKGGEPAEIVVKDGEVFVNGEKIEDGKPFAIAGGDDGEVFVWDGSQGTVFEGEGQNFFFPPDAHGFNFSNEGSAEELRARAEVLREEAELHRKELEKQLKQQEKEWKNHEKDLKKAEKEYRKQVERQMQEVREAQREVEQVQREAMREVEQSQRDAQREVEMAQREAMREAERAQRDAWRAESDARRQAMKAERGADFSQKLMDELFRDGLITDRRNCSVEFSRKKLKVNGKKQPQEVLEKYLEFFRRENGKEMGANDKYQWSIND